MYFYKLGENTAFEYSANLFVHNFVTSDTRESAE